MDYFLLYALAFVAIIVFFRMIRVVPEAHALVVEELGKYKKTLGPGLHLVIPILQRVGYKHVLKEEVMEKALQQCSAQPVTQRKVFRETTPHLEMQIGIYHL